jgi:hypothetical protein
MRRAAPQPLEGALRSPPLTTWLPPPCLPAYLPVAPSQICSLSQPCYYTAASLALLVVAYLVLFFLASNLIVPGGLFM